MTKRITPPDWNQWDKNMFIIVDDMRLYYENFTAVVDDATKTNATAIDGLDSRVTALEHNKPIGPGGDGAFLALGGVPSDYPTKAQMTGPDGKETSYLVVARNDGIYFYNPVTKDLMVPKTNGGRIAINAQFPQTFDTTHEAKHDGRQSISGFYTADVKTLGLETQFTTHDICKMLVVVADTGVEYQTAFHADGIASRYFLAGQPASTWSIVGGGSGSGVGPGIIQDLTDRIVELEKYNHNNTNFINLDDTPTSYNGHQFKAVTVRGDEMGVEFTSIVTKDVYDAEILNQRAIDKQHDDHVKRIDAVLANNEVRIDGVEKAIPNHTDRLDAHEIRIAAIEIGGGGGGSADIGPLLVRLTALEDEDKIHANRLDDIEMVNNDQDNTLIDHEDRIDALETSGGAVPPDLIDRLDDIELKNTEQDDRLDILESTPSDVTKAALATGNELPVDAKGVSSQVYVGWDSVLIANSAKYESVVFWGNSTKRGFELPDIVNYNAEAIADNGEVRVGRTITITNKSTTAKFVKPMNGCTIWRSDTSTDGGQFDLPSGNTIILTAWKNGANKYWAITGSYGVNEVPGASTLKSDLVSGAQMINWNSLGVDPMATSGDVSASALAGAPFCVGQGTSTGKKFTLPEIVDKTVTTLTNTQVREGRITYLVNLGTQTRTVELTAGCKFNMGGSNITDIQNIPSKAVWVFSPGIYSNGDKVWTFLGGFSAETIDFKVLVDRVTALEALPPPAGVSVFTDLTDTPTNYTGHGEKLVVVKADESGLEFIEHGDITDYGDRIQDLEDNMAEHLLDFEMMGDGHIETSWNGLGAPSLSILNDVTAENIATTPFVIAQGSVAGKKFTMPDIVAKDTKGLGATEVREGRTTYLINLSTVSRKVQVSAGCKFNMTGGAVSTDQEIPRKTVWIFSPTLAAGDKVWTFIGTLSAEAIDIRQLTELLAQHESRLGMIEPLAVATDASVKALSTGSTYVSLNTLGGDVSGSSGAISANTVATTPFLILPGSTSRNITLPTIVAKDTSPLAAGQVRVGRVTYFGNVGSATKTLVLGTDQKFYINGTYVDTSVGIPQGTVYIFVPAIYGSQQTWSLVGSLNNSLQVGKESFTELTDTPNSYTGHANKVPRVRANETGMDFVDLPAGKEKFTELTDTPSGYHPNKLVGYNLAGDALIPVDKTDSFLQLTDTPSTYTGNARKVPMVRPDSSGMDFVDLPAGKQNFAELDDTPSGYQAGKLLAYNLSGTAVVGVDKTFKSLNDTPSDYSGHKNKMLVLNNGETALEFKAVPDISGLQSDIDANHNAIIALQNADTIQGNNITALTTQVTGIESDITALQSADTALGARITAVEEDVTVTESEMLYNGLVGSGNYTQANAATFNPCILRHTSYRSLELPVIVDATATPTSTQSRAGRSLLICNFCDGSSFTINGNEVGRQLRTWNGTVLGSKGLSAKECMEVIAMKVGTTYYWQIIREWTVS